MSEATWVTLSFAFSTVTNLVVLFGILSFIYWIWGNKTPLVAKYHDLLEILLAAAYTGYALVLAALNSHFTTPLLGLHWTGLNLLVVAIFIFDLLLANRWQFAIGVLETLGYAWFMGGRPTPAVLALLAGLILVQAFASFGGYRFWRNHAVMLGSLALAGVLAMGLMWVIGGSLDFAGFWSRQIIAFVVIAVGAYEYFRMLLVSQLRVESQIELDELTGLKNFRTFDHDMHTRYAGYRQNGTGLTLLELDIDWFKRINDTYDHLVGNAVLKGVGQATAAFAQALPQTAAAYRLGGEEFCIAVTALPQDAALGVAQALKAKLDALTFTADGAAFSITVSVGLAEAIPADLNYLDVYKRVDHFLYEAKRAGRDRLNIGGRIVA